MSNATDTVLAAEETATDVISQSIKIGGTAISDKIGVYAITVTRQLNKIAGAKVVLIDGNAAERKFELSNQDLFIPGKEIEILLGYKNQTKKVFKGIITKHAVKAQNSCSFLYLEAKDKCVNLSLRRKNNYFHNQTDNAIIKKICSDASIETEIETTLVTHKEMVQYNCSDWDFVLTRAEMNSMFVSTEDGKLIIKKPSALSTPVFAAKYGENIFSFEADMDARRQHKTIKSHAWNFDDQKIKDSVKGNFSFTENGNISTNKLAEIFNSADFNLSHAAFLSDDELKQWANAYAMKNVLSKICGKLKIKGCSAILPGSVITVAGMSDRFNGNVFVTGVQHIFSTSDWQTEVQFGWCNEWFYKTDDIEEKPAAGLVPGINGLHTGIVVALKGDPDGEYRVKVKIPLINKDDEGTWARIALLDAGKERSSFFLPEINDEVVLGFVNDDPRHAIILGMLHSKAMKAPVEATDENHIKGFYTRSKMKVEFDDDKKSITIITPKKKSIVISDEDGSIILSDELNNKITMNSEGISIESQKDIKLKAAGNIKAEATKNCELKATASLKTEGTSSVSLKSSGITTVKGSIVKIN